jgi:uncharacterized membrane protein YqjE
MGQQAFMALIGQLLAGLREAAREQLRQLDLEAQRACRALALLLAYGVLAALLLGFAWMGLCGVLVLFLVERNLSPSLALLMAVLLNLLGVLACVLAARREARLLSVPGTHKGLGGGMLLWLAWRQLRPPTPASAPVSPPPPPSS